MILLRHGPGQAESENNTAKNYITPLELTCTNHDAVTETVGLYLTRLYLVETWAPRLAPKLHLPGPRCFVFVSVCYRAETPSHPPTHLVSINLYKDTGQDVDVEGSARREGV